MKTLSLKEIKRAKARHYKQHIEDYNYFGYTLYGIDAILHYVNHGRVSREFKQELLRVFFAGMVYPGCSNEGVWTYSAASDKFIIGYTNRRWRQYIKMYRKGLIDIF